MPLLVEVGERWGPGSSRRAGAPRHGRGARPGAAAARGRRGRASADAPCSRARRGERHEVGLLALAALLAMRGLGRRLPGRRDAGGRGAGARPVGGCGVSRASASPARQPLEALIAGAEGGAARRHGDRRSGGQAADADLSGSVACALRAVGADALPALGRLGAVSPARARGGRRRGGGHGLGRPRAARPPRSSAATTRTSPCSARPSRRAGTGCSPAWRSTRSTAPPSGSAFDAARRRVTFRRGGSPWPPRWRSTSRCIRSAPCRPLPPGPRRAGHPAAAHKPARVRAGDRAARRLRTRARPARLRDEGQRGAARRGSRPRRAAASAPLSVTGSLSKRSTARRLPRPRLTCATSAASAGRSHSSSGSRSGTSVLPPRSTKAPARRSAGRPGRPRRARRAPPARFGHGSTAPYGCAGSAAASTSASTSSSATAAALAGARPRRRARTGRRRGPRRSSRAGTGRASRAPSARRRPRRSRPGCPRPARRRA